MFFENLPISVDKNKNMRISQEQKLQFMMKLQLLDNGKECRVVIDDKNIFLIILFAKMLIFLGKIFNKTFAFYFVLLNSFIKVEKKHFQIGIDFIFDIFK